MQYVNRKEGCCMQYLNQEGWGNRFQHSSGSDNASGGRAGALNCFQIYLSVSQSVCLSVGRSVRPSGCLCLYPRGFCFPLHRCSGLSSAPHSAVFITKRCRFGGGERAARWRSECCGGGWRSLRCWCKHWMMPALPLASKKSMQHAFLSLPTRPPFLCSRGTDASACWLKEFAGG